MAQIIKIDRNGSKHYEGMITCERCGGLGIFAIGVHNGEIVPAHPDNGVCYKCGGVGKVRGKWIERTPEYQAKLDARRKAKQEAEQARLDAERAEREAKLRAEQEAEEARIRAEEARIRAEKAISQHVGEIGQRLEIKGTYIKTGSWEQKSFVGYGVTTMYIHTFKDSDGNVFTWKTQNGICLNYGEAVIIKGSVKNHSEYKEEKQTELARCRITALADIAE